MALVSPGVQVSVIDESFYTPAEPGTVPLIFVATKENKTNPGNTGIAPGTLKSNAGKVYLISSQRELSETFGDPLFYTDANNNPIHGGEQNEYGLQAAYSYLGVANRAYIVRADVDLNSITASNTPVTGDPTNGSYWFDTDASFYGVFEWNGAAITTTNGQSFLNKVPMVITDTTKVVDYSGEDYTPKGSVGAIGDYAIVAVTDVNTLWYKNRVGTWVKVGTPEWKASHAIVTGSNANPTLIAGRTITFNTFLEQYEVSQIDFMKIDCEGGEYDIFTTERLPWIKQNVKKIVGEWHLATPELKEKFRTFRDTYLKQFHTFDVYSWDGVDIKWDLWNDHFIDYYNEITLYIDNRRSEKKEYWRLTSLPTLEFTTSIPPKGCVIDCAFCPQRTLLNVYKADKTMTFENFKKVIDKLPKEVRVTFSGFTEPWLNKRCTDMLIYASQQGHPIAAFTTGVGMTVEDVERIKDIKFDGGENGGLCLHIPDQELIAKHPITPRLIEVFERFKELENHIENFYVMCMGEVHESVKHLWPEVHVPTFWSRAGNLLGEAIIKPELEKYKDRFQHMDHGDKPMTCGCVEDLYHNVVLPNGDVSLCCMDYGLKHILGNIFEQDYEDVIPRPLQCFSLCQGCENAVSPDKK